MNRTGIEYLDRALNLFCGCRGIGCAVGLKRCWAAKMGKRQKCQLCHDFLPHYHSERWLQPFKEKTSRRVGLNFMGETFDGDNVRHRRDELKEMMVMVKACFWHKFTLLTKHPETIPSWLELPSNLELGVTVNYPGNLWRLRKLLEIPGPFMPVLSAEPLYMDLGQIPFGRPGEKQLGWIIIGAQTRPRLLPARCWVTSLIHQARAHKVPVFLKNNLQPLFPGLRLFQEYPGEH